MKNKSILVIGSINVDHCMHVKALPKPGETVSGSEYNIVGGGKGANQALACARLGGQTTLIANIGTDDFGSTMVNNFTKDGIDTAFIKVINGEKTGVAMIFVDDGAENSIGIIAGANNTLSPEQVRFHENIISQSDFVLMQLEIPLETVIEASIIAHKHQTQVVLNPAPARYLPDSLLQYIDIITPNQTETEILTGVKVHDNKTAKVAAQILHDKGIDTVLITMGKKGAYLSTKELKSCISAIKVNAIDTTAAGDVFNGAFLVGLSNGMEVIDAVHFANKCAAVSVTRAGAQTSIPYIDEIM